MSKVTLDSIAAELDVSKNTVSRALRGLPGVSDDMRKKIVSLAGETGYNMKAKGNLPLHVVMLYRKSLTNDVIFWPSVLSGIMDFAADRGVSVRVVTVESGKGCNGTLASVREEKCDGLLVVNDIEEPLLQQLERLRLPMTVVDFHSMRVECDYVNTANVSGICKAIEYLAANNHKRIGFIGNADRMYSFRERYDAYRRFMGERGLPVDERFVWFDAGYEDYQYFREKIKLLGACKERPTAWVCVNDIMAENFMRVLGEFAYRIPEDVSVIGFDNFMYKSDSAPKLTTFEVPTRYMGYRALEQLLLRIKSPERPYETLLLGVKMILRDSVGPAEV